ncbi:class I SAM-dependent methyltransferase [Shumkonia mesophila]|uniref:class I SAM-dependent methyltransferase n=1 Tax=Shumkonia mesophila TaxID=2838854 RepID=UPI00293443D2|nr:class I SAM-dependent methyltransferase [Shumkonia mesophila]
MLTENEIRPDTMREEQARRFAQDIHRLNERKGEFVAVPCPACGDDHPVVRFEKYGLTYVDCLSCGTLYVNPRPTPGILAWYYETSEHYRYWNTFIFPASEVIRREKIFRPRVDRLVDICHRFGVPTHTLLEVGAGYGTFGEAVLETGLFGRYVAVEPTPDLAATCRKKGLEVIELPIEQTDLPDDFADIVVSFEVIEHLFSPRVFIEASARLLASGGVLILSCPNVRGFEVEVLQAASDTVDVEHLNYFNPESLSDLVARCGFTVLETTTPGELDAELVRKKVLVGDVDLDGQTFLKRVLIDEWERLAEPFQKFLWVNGLSSHLWLVARKA